MEQAYKGNFYLLALIDGKERKFVLGKNKDDYSFIESTGIVNLSPEQLKNILTYRIAAGNIMMILQYH